jgi:hypothetical protein
MRDITPDLNAPRHRISNVRIVTCRIDHRSGIGGNETM